MIDSINTATKSSRRLFITGTDTDVGKTVFTIRLMQALKVAGYQVAGFKPVAAGSLVPADNDSELDFGNEDAVLIQHQSSFNQSYQSVNPTLFAEPVAPHIAAAREQINLDVSQHSQQIEHELVHLCATDEATVAVIEGAGGWRVPFNDNQYFSDLALQLKAGVILVVAIRLGCISHALLTAEAIIRDGLPLLGWVANCCSKDDLYIEENIQTLANHLNVPLVARLPYLDSNPYNSVHSAQQEGHAGDNWVDVNLIKTQMADMAAHYS